MRLIARLLLPLLLRLCCDCFAAQNKISVSDLVIDKFDDHKGTNELPSQFEPKGPNLVVPHLEIVTNDPTGISREAEFPCPDAATIAPCVCTIGINSTVNLDCTLVESDEQLQAVFKEGFPTKSLYQFNMVNNSAITLFHDFLNGVSFEKVNLSPGPFALEAISNNFLLDINDTLNELNIVDSRLTTEFFPFYLLPYMNQLESLYILGSNIDRIPEIRAPILSTLMIQRSLVQSVEIGTFSIGAGPMSIDLSSNLINSIEPESILFADNTGASSEEVLHISMSYNQLQSLQAETFPIRNGPVQFSLQNNQITSIKPGTFYLPSGTSTSSIEPIFVTLQNNELQSLEAETFPIRRGRGEFRFYMNQIASIEPGTFFLLETPGGTVVDTLLIDLSDNMLQSLQAGTFPLRNGPAVIYLSRNQIDFIEPGTFVLPSTSAREALSIILTLQENMLQTVEEAVFADLMPYVLQLQLYSNPLFCGCDIAWLVLNPDYMALVDSTATCADGTNLHDLDPQQFIDFC